MKIPVLFLTACIIFISCEKVPDASEKTSNYSLLAKLDTTDLSLSCIMDVEWYNSSDEDIIEIPFLFALDSAKTLVKSVEAKGQEVGFRYASNGNDGYEGFVVELKQPVKPSMREKIQLVFKTKPNEFFREKMLFYSEDFPSIQYFCEGQFNSTYQVHSDYDVQITFPFQYRIAATGEIQSRDTINKDATVSTLAESVPSYGFVLMKEVVLKEDFSSGVFIRSFYFKDDSKWGEKLLDYSKNIIEFYTDTLGFYPQPVLSIIPGYPKPYGGWPVCPNVVGIHRGIDSKMERAETHAHWIMAHEIGHQYWGFNYTLEPIDYPQWFGIGMGIHTDKLYTLEYILGFNHSKYFSDSYLQAMKKGHNTTIMQTIDTLDDQAFDWNNSIEHDKSFSVLNMLSYELGEDVFFKILLHCLHSYKGVNVTLDMFQKDCETISGKDLGNFFQTWFFTNKYLEYQIVKVSTVENSNHFENEIKINKLGEADISHVEVAVELKGGEREALQYNGSEQKVVLQLTTLQPIEEIIIDPDLKLLLVNRTVWNQ